MSRGIAQFVLLGFMGAVMIAATWVLTFKLTPDERKPRILRWLLTWSGKGLAAPLLLWALMNVGLSFDLQPFLPDIQIAKNNALDWVPEFLGALGIGLFVVGSYWAAATLSWVLIEVVQGIEGAARKDFRGLCLTCGLGLLLPAGLIFLLGGWIVMGFSLTLVLGTIAAYAPASIEPRKLPPMYARAVARMKFGKYQEAEWEIIRQLEKSENDFDGWMMLAELYASHFNDLPEAERTILEICDQPKSTPTQLSVALQRLADWQLKMAQDPEAARRALQMIIHRLPGTHLARMAQLRINQLPISQQDLRERQKVNAIPLPALGDHFEDDVAPEDTGGARQSHVDEANACVERLRQDPNNLAARERLARLLAEHLGNARQGIEQAMLLLNLPEQPDAKRAEWLSLIAAWYLRYLQDEATGRRQLERLVRDFPHTPQALAARRRLELLDRQSKSADSSPSR
jgi:hypothetical protein